jgi:Uma2 family endonuclease
LTGTELIVSTQNPLRLSDLSEPVPDVAILNFHPDDYDDELATAADVKLLIEVADSSVGTDRTIKLNLYALAGIPEVWVVNLRERDVEVFADPSEGNYLAVTKYSLEDVVVPRSLPSAKIKVSEMFSKDSKLG